mmetsp:Transcript_13899/g.38197  ORF Transcript_13899/g.38197 Transcript_13899/m.38197 type:complete len:326 (-) Transcript_13899:334-1311(-)
MMMNGSSARTRNRSQELSFLERLRAPIPANDFGSSVTGIRRMMNPIGKEMAPNPIVLFHSSQDRGVVCVKSPPNSTIAHCATTVKKITMRNIGERFRDPIGSNRSPISRALNSLNTWQKTKALKMMVKWWVDPSSQLYITGPLSRRKTSRASWYVAWTKMLRHIGRLIKLASRRYGRRSRSSRVGGSVPRARAPMVSMIRFTQSIMTAFSGGLYPARAERKVIVKATTFTVSWNCRNLRMLSNTERPHKTALTMEENRSSMMMMSEAFLATSVPERPMERPTSAALRAGPSFVPSPVTPTTSPTPPRFSLHSSLYPGRRRSFSFS